MSIELRIKPAAGALEDTMQPCNNNIFRQAKRLLDKKDSGVELTEEEQRLINTAIIPLMVKTNGIFPDITIGEGLKELAEMVEEKGG